MSHGKEAVGSKRKHRDGDSDDEAREYDQAYAAAMDSAQRAHRRQSGGRASCTTVAAVPTQFLRHALTMHCWLRRKASDEDRNSGHAIDERHSSIFELKMTKLRRLFISFCEQYNDERLPLDVYEKRDNTSLTSSASLADRSISVERIASGRFPPCLADAPSVLTDPSWYTNYRWRFVERVPKEAATAARETATAVHLATHCTSWGDLPREEDGGGRGRPAAQKQF